MTSPYTATNSTLTRTLLNEATATFVKDAKDAVSVKEFKAFFCFKYKLFIQLLLASSNADELRIERDAIQRKYNELMQGNLNLMQDVEQAKVEMGRWKTVVCDYITQQKF